MQINVPGAKPARALILKKISLFPLKTIEYVLFAALVLYKLYIFDQDLGFDFFLGDMVKVSLGSVLIVSCWTLLLPRYSRIVALWLLDCLLSLLIVSDVVYYRYFHDFITIPVLLQAKQVSALGDSIGSLLTWQDVAYVGDCLLLLLLIFCKRQFSVDKTDFLQRAAYAAIAAIVGFMLVFMPIKAYTDQYGTSLFENNWWNLSIFNITGLLGFHAYDIKRFADQNWFDKGKVTAADKLAIQQWFADHRQQLAEKTPLFGAAKGKNVMIVQLESFQNFMIGKTVNGEEITPNLNRLKSEMLYFSRHYTMIGQGHTSDAEFTVNTSLHPLPVGSVYVRYPHHL
ncbi:MAG TPA: LTA synthase family protein, partial [Bacilli bacterium]